MELCLECKAPADHQHHVVPQSLGGTVTVPLCERCHGLVHDCGMTGHRRLTRAGMARVRAEGRHTGGDPPYGFKLAADGTTLLEAQDEVAIMLEVRRLRDAGLSIRAIAATLAEQGRRGRRGEPLRAGLVQRVLARE